MDELKKKERENRFWENHDKKQYYHKLYLKRREKVLMKFKTRQYKISEYSKEKNRESQIKHINIISDYYCRKKLLEAGFKKENITGELIELKRQQIKLKRLVNEKLQ